MQNTDEGYEYDVAFSFLNKDLAVATAIEQEVRPNFQTFIYTERQSQLVGSMASESFRETYRKKSRLVVILFREGWGKSPVTRIEEQAIKDRVFNDGFDFFFVIKMDQSPLPVWVPDQMLWLDWAGYETRDAVGAIKYRLQQLGAQFSIETLEQRARRSRRQAAIIAERERLMKTEYHQRFTEGVAAVKAAIEEGRGKLNESFPLTSWNNHGDPAFRDPQTLVGSILASDFSTDGARLRQRRIVGLIAPGEHRPFIVEPTFLEDREWLFDWAGDIGWHWRAEDLRLDAETLADVFMKQLLDDIDAKNRGEVGWKDLFDDLD